ncbi:ferritin-like domain-containing protein [Haloferula sargassicola]|uniref:Protein YciF n=1 Tax=Haloferula sargassicola TaxID=490096 RepID=A0ABP9URW4_9BACT
MKIDSLEKLLVHELKDLYSAESQIIKALPKMEEAASSEELKTAFREHLEETQTHAQRLEDALDQLGFKTGGEHCDGCEGLIEEGEQVIKEIEKGEVRDAALIAAAQRVEHYEMAGYGSVVSFARQLGRDEMADLLQQTLEEEENADSLLTEIAESSVNESAEEGS